MTSPRAVFGFPSFNGERHVREAVESLLRQELTDFRVVVVDDGSTDATLDIVGEYAREDQRVTCVRNPQQLGMVANWRRTFDLARQLYGGFEYFAWASDHDAWHPRWLAALVRALDADDEAVLAYPLTLGVDDGGEVVIRPRRFDTQGVHDRWTRLAKSVNGMTAGTMVYGLYRAQALEKSGVFHPVLLPDRRLLAQLSLFGSFVQVHERLWYRRYRSGIRPSYGRQRASFFPDGAPIYSYLPWWMMHTGSLACSLLLGTGRPPGMGRGAAMLVVGRYMQLSVVFSLRRRFSGVRAIARPRRALGTAVARLRPIIGRYVPYAHSLAVFADRHTRAWRT